MQSPFLRLAAELRIRIYEYALGGMEIRSDYIGNSADLFSADTCSILTCRAPSQDWHCPRNILGLTRVCCQTRAEGLPIFFASNQFGGTVTRLFMGFSDLFPDPETCNLLKTVRIILQGHDFCVGSIDGLLFNHVTRLPLTLHNLLSVLGLGIRLQHLIVEWPGTIFFPSTRDSLSDSLKAKIKDVLSNNLTERSGIEVEVICSSDEVAWGGLHVGTRVPDGHCMCG
jgi:hypothetical protein